MKNNISKTKFILSLVILLFASKVFSNEYVKFSGWKQAETAHFTFIYESASELAAKEYAKIADEAWDKIAQIYSMPQEKTNVYVLGRQNIVNAYTYFAPPCIVMYNSPIIEETFGFRDDWMKLFFTHELIHIANITFEDKSYSGAKIFGEFFRNMDYAALSGWAMEGLTTVLETELTNGGRGRSPYFELQFKAPTLDNSFIPYRLIGSEKEMPTGQIYVMGYLLMRTIADRWGIQALADIERNRSYCATWEEAVYTVTGKTAEDLYREVKIALEKKYAKERTITEGKIVSPNYNATHTYKPAIIFDDGSYITLYEENNSLSAIHVYPEENYHQSLLGSNISSSYYYTLFKAKFSDEKALTADINSTTYSSIEVSRADRFPGEETIYQIFKQTSFGDLQQLTHDTSSYYQPAVSRDGTVLVAVEQNDMKMQIVKIDTFTGDKTVLFHDDNYSFIQPTLNKDGSKIAFLLIKDDRACVALGDTKTATYKIVNNLDDEKIVDPSQPNFNQDGTLTFASNDRGRIEIYQADYDEETDRFTCKPMLADPIGALWAYKNDLGVFYSSFSSTGNIVKIKPLEEWGNVPDFDGPSPAGEIMHFGELQDDYPDFNPFVEKTDDNKTVDSDKTDEADNTVDTNIADNTIDSENIDNDSNTENTETTDNTVKEEIEKYNPYYFTRSKEKIDQLQNNPEPITELTNEKRFYPSIYPLIKMPFVEFISDTNDKTRFGLGYVYLGTTSRNNDLGFFEFDSFYFPGINNFSGEILSQFNIGNSILDIFIIRNFSLVDLNSGEQNFKEKNLGILGLTIPIYHRYTNKNEQLVSLLTSTVGNITRTGANGFAVNDNVATSKSFSFQLGLEFASITDSYSYSKIDIDCLSLNEYSFDTNKLYPGFETEINSTFGFESSKEEIDLVLRYTNFPSQIIPTFSRAHLFSLSENCEYPGKLLIQSSTIYPNLFEYLDGKFLIQGLLSFGSNKVDYETPGTKLPLNLKLEPKINLAFEADLPSTTNQIGGGVASLIDFTNWDDIKFTINFYITCKFNWIRL